MSTGHPLAVLAAAAVAALALALAACKSDGDAKDSPRYAKAGADAGGNRSSLLPADSPLARRLMEVDGLIVQWDAAQADGQDESAAALAARIRETVDGDLPAIVAAARGGSGLRAQNVAVQGLGFSKDPSATSVLVERLLERNPALVGNALISLKLRADPATPLPQIVALLRSRDLEPRRFAPLALANVALAREAAGQPVESRIADDALPGLVNLSQDRDPVVRLHATKAMGALRRSEANDFLVVLLKDEHVRIRVAAAAALERIGDPRTFPQVVILLDACEEGVKTLVRDVLVSYAERLQGAPLTDAQKQELGTSPRAWDRWFAGRAARPAPAPKSG